MRANIVSMRGVDPDFAAAALIVTRWEPMGPDLPSAHGGRPVPSGTKPTRLIKQYLNCP